ncbi:hypothetical protein [Pyxidicoccus trucidator]|uniref:hypothetical protein n=1 Tax=Pyxidicoccus trucidator TaxID=2709662 RepID=UPI0013DA7497|nr:hypothetical protein [Pyxidicoccus trucidator]
MKVRSLIASTLAAATLSACGESTAPAAAPVNQAPFIDALPERRVPVSGVVFDPEALFYAFVTWPVNPEDPNDGAPPPALLYGLPTEIRASVWFAQVNLLGPEGQVADSSGPSLPPWGNFQTQGVVPDRSVVYAMRAEPTPMLSVGAGDFFPAEAGFAPIPAVPYHATTTLRPVSPTGNQCLVQAPVMVGEAGALGALAQTLSTETGTPTTVAQLVDPARGSVALVWMFAPSPVLDLFMFPSGDIAAETTVGTLYAIDWAPPSGAPGQSEMGFTATRNGVSSLGYYALVVPPGTSTGVSVSFVDTVTDEQQGRPWIAPPFEAGGLPPGLSFARLHAMAPVEETPEDPYAEPYPPPDFSFLCFPDPPSEG